MLFYFDEKESRLGAEIGGWTPKNTAGNTIFDHSSFCCTHYSDIPTSGSIQFIISGTSLSSCPRLFSNHAFKLAIINFACHSFWDWISTPLTLQRSRIIGCRLTINMVPIIGLDFHELWMYLEYRPNAQSCTFGELPVIFVYIFNTLLWINHQLMLHWYALLY